jgi:hypothetical protein
LWAAAGLLAAGAVSQPSLSNSEQQLRRELASACRWLEEHTLPPGPWGAATAIQDWGVGVEPELAPLVAWHARRAALGLGGRWTAGGGARALAESLRDAQSWEDLSRAGRALGLRYWLLTPRTLESLSLPAGASWTLAGLREEGRLTQFGDSEISILALDSE